MSLIKFSETNGLLKFTSSRNIKLTDGQYVWDRVSYYDVNELFMNGFDEVGLNTPPPAANRYHEGKIWNDAGDIYICRNATEFEAPEVHEIEVNINSETTVLFRDIINITRVELYYNGNWHYFYIKPVFNLADYFYNQDNITVRPGIDQYVYDQMGFFVRGEMEGNYIEYGARPVPCLNNKSYFLRNHGYLELLPDHVSGGYDGYEIARKDIRAPYKINFTTIKLNPWDSDDYAYSLGIVPQYLTMYGVYSGRRTSDPNVRYLTNDNHEIYYDRAGSLYAGFEIIGISAPLIIKGNTTYPITKIRVFGSKRKNT